MVQRMVDIRAAQGRATKPGTVEMFGSSANAPPGWLVCDGRTLDASANPQYQRLFEVIGTTFGGTGQSDFNLPDLRGEFARGADDMGTGSRGVDGGRAEGSVQGEATAANGLGASGATGNQNTSHGHGFSDSFGVDNDTHDHSLRNSGDDRSLSIRSGGSTTADTGFDRIESVGGERYQGVSPLNAVTAGDTHNHSGSVSGTTGNQDSSHDHNFTATVSGDSETRPRNVAMNYIIKL